MSFSDSLVKSSSSLSGSTSHTDCISSAGQLDALRPDASESGSSSLVISLPTYSDRVMSAIRTGSVVSEFDRMVEETAYHILKHGDILNRADYDAFGRRLHECYPCIAFPGTEPWVMRHTYFLIF